METGLLDYAMRKQVASGRVGGCEFGLAHLWRNCGIPKATFYRSVKHLIDDGFIDRVGRNKYRLNSDFKKLCLRVGVQ